MAHVPERMEDMSSYREGQVHQLMDRLEGEGFTAEHLTRLGQYERLDLVKSVLEGDAEIKMIKKAAPEPKPIMPLLELISIVVVPPLGKRFIAKKKFVVDNGRRAKAKISHLGDNFIAWFFTGLGKVEEPMAEQMLRQMRLNRLSVDTPIIAELGGEEKSETTLFEMFYLMELQNDGQAGVLLTNGYANIFYVRDVSGVLRAVSVDWHVSGWGVLAYEVTRSGWWYDGYQVFSRN